MSFSITHRGQKLTQQQLDALVPVLNRHMHGEIKKRDLDAEFDKALEAAGCPVVVPGDPVALTVWYGAMPESNGKSNWTAILYRRGGDIADGITIARSEYPDRVRYEADRMKYLIGEIAEEPCILDYDADKHSGYVATLAPPAAVTAPQGWKLDWLEHGVIRVTMPNGGGCVAGLGASAIAEVVLYEMSAALIRAATSAAGALPEAMVPLRAVKAFVDAISTGADGQRFEYVAARSGSMFKVPDFHAMASSLPATVADGVVHEGAQEANGD